MNDQGHVRVHRGIAAAWQPPRRRAIGRERLRLSRETLLADAAFLATVAAIVVLVGVSQITLEAFGYTYISAGGPFWQKLHPATPIAFVALMLRCLASGRPLATAGRLATNDAGLLLYLTAIVLTGAFSIIVVKTPITPLVDTFLLPILFFLLLRDLDERMARMLALVLVALLAANAVIALAEFLSGWRLITVTVPDGVTADPSRTDLVFDWRADLAMEWRATALLGHPIESGGIVGSFILCLTAFGCRWLPPLVRFPLLLLQVVSLFAYGSRLPLILALGMAGAMGFYEGARKVVGGVRLAPRSAAIVVCALLILAGGAALAFGLGVFDRTIDRFADDAGSASKRVTMFKMFDPLSLYDLLFGPNQDLVATWKRLEGLEFGIESSWVGLVLNYGAIIAGMIGLGLVAFATSLLRVAGRGAWAVVVFFFVDVSVSTGLSGKTTAMATMTVLLLLFVRRTTTPFTFAGEHRSVAGFPPFAEAPAPTGVPAAGWRENR